LLKLRIFTEPFFHFNLLDIRHLYFTRINITQLILIGQKVTKWFYHTKVSWNSTTKSFITEGKPYSKC